MPEAPVGLISFAGASAVIGLACAAVAVPAATGCSTHQCDSDFVVAPAGTVHVDGQNIVWESGPLVPDRDGGGATEAGAPGAWLDYRGLRTFVFHFPPPFAADTEITAIVPYVSSSTDPLNPASPNFVLAAGNLAEITDVSGTGMSVQNATCAEYFLRIEVQGRLAAHDGGNVSALPGDASAD